MTLDKLVSLYKEAGEIYMSRLSWKAKYDLMIPLNQIIKLDYCDPDTSYQEDCEAFMRAFAEYMGTDKKWVKPTDIIESSFEDGEK